MRLFISVPMCSFKVSPDFNSPALQAGTTDNTGREDGKTTTLMHESSVPVHVRRARLKSGHVSSFCLLIEGQSDPPGGPMMHRGYNKKGPGCKI